MASSVHLCLLYSDDVKSNAKLNSKSSFCVEKLCSEPQFLAESMHFNPRKWKKWDFKLNVFLGFSCLALRSSGLCIMYMHA